MRTVIVLMISAGMALAQQAARPSQQLAAEQYGLQQLAVLRAQLAALKADETLSQMKMLELLKTHQESHPEVVALQRKMDRLRAQEGGLAQAVRSLDALKSLKEINGGLQTSPDRWWRNPATAQSL